MHIDGFNSVCFLSFFILPSEKNNLSFIETSALDSTNVEEAFKNILTGRGLFSGHFFVLDYVSLQLN